MYRRPADRDERARRDGRARRDDPVPGLRRPGVQGDASAAATSQL